MLLIPFILISISLIGDIAASGSSGSDIETEPRTKLAIRQEKRFQEFLRDPELQKALRRMVDDCGLPPENPLIAKWLEEHPDEHE